MKKKPVDMAFLINSILLIAIGFFIFISAALGILTKQHLSLSKTILHQFGLGIVLGSLALYLASRINYKLFHKWALHIFIGAIFITLLVFVPHIGFSHGGARRWLSLGPLSFQPAELLKIAFVVYFAAWLSGIKSKITNFKLGTLPMLILLGLIGIILFLQPDIGTLFVIGCAAIAMYIAGGGSWKHIVLLGVLACLVGGALFFTKPYIRQRVTTFLNPASDPLGSGYQVQQSLIAIGSGQTFGRGFGQSVQKFSFLPEPVGDSIFAVFAEEWGFLGSVVLIGLFVSLAIRGLKIASQVPNTFGRLLVVGIVILIMTQAFINIASMLAVFPLTGDPLPFVSQGGTSLLLVLAEIGIILSVSHHRVT